MSDPERTSDVLAAARSLPEGSTLIYRHFGHKEKAETAKALREITFVRNLQFLIGQDVELVAQIGADGVHLPERALGRGADLRKHYPHWLITGAAHSREAVKICADNKLDAAILSPVFASESKSAGEPIRVSGITNIVSKADIPVIALGGISSETAVELYGSNAAGIAGVSMFAGASMSNEMTSKYTTQLAEIHGTAFSPGWSADDFSAHMGLASDDIVDIVVGGEVQGFAITRTAVDQAEILTIVVAPTHQRKGLGQSLLRLAEACVRERGADVMFLDVAADNQAAIHLYKNSGYHQCGTRPRYYRREVNGIVGRVDAVLYKKHLA